MKYFLKQKGFMVNLIKSILLSSLFKLESNKEITLDLGNTVRPYFSTIYSDYYEGSIAIHKENIVFLKEKELDPITEEQTSTGKLPKIKRIIFADSKNSIPIVFDTSSLYFLGYSTNEGYYKLLDKYKEAIFNPKTCTVLIDHSTYVFLKFCLSQSNATATLRIKEIGPYWVQVLLPIILLISAGSIYIVGRYIIKKLSKLDPVFADFNISSSNIVKYKDILVKSMNHCTICFEEFEPENDIRILGCFHYYHPACIDRWLIGHSRKCPCCRLVIEVNEKS